MEKSPLADLTPEERQECLKLVEETPIDQHFVDMFCEIFNIPNLDLVEGDKNAKNEEN